MTRVPFGQRLTEAMQHYGPIAAGVDPHPSMLDRWSLTDTPQGVRDFGLRCVEAFTGVVAAIKPQVALFERHGSAGIAALEEVLQAARHAGLLTIADAKRGDIDSTMAAYAHAYLDDHSPLVADAVTLSPYLGYESLRPALDLAAERGRGVFVLCLTSNPAGPSVQHAITADQGTVAESIMRAAAQDNGSSRPLGSVGLVIGATIGTAIQDLGLPLAQFNGPILAPGLGAQGATPEDLRQVFGAALPAVLATTSRALLAHGPDTQTLTQAARELAHHLRRELTSPPHS